MGTVPLRYGENGNEMKRQTSNTIAVFSAAVLGIALSTVGIADDGDSADRPEDGKKTVLQGEWSEKRYTERMSLSFSTNGLGVFYYRGRTVRYSWTLDGDGSVSLKAVDHPNAPSLPPVSYDAVKNVIDLKLDKETKDLGFTGKLRFASKDLHPIIQQMVDAPLPKPPQRIDRQKAFERLLAEKPWGFHRVDSLLEELDPLRRNERKTWFETVDGEYPRIEPGRRQEMHANEMSAFIVHGRYEADRSVEHIEMEYGRRDRDCNPEDPPCQTGLPKAQVESMCAELKKEGIYCAKGSYDIGSGKAYWREDYAYVAVEEPRYEAFCRIMQKYFPESICAPRYIQEKRISDYYDFKAGEAYDVDWPDGKPRLTKRRKL